MITLSITLLKWIIAGLGTIGWRVWVYIEKKNNPSSGGMFSFDFNGLLPFLGYMLFWIIWLIIFYVIL